MFKLADFPSIDFSGLDLNALRDSELAKRIAAIDLPRIDLPRIDTDKVSAFVRDAAYLTVGVGVTVSRMARQQVRGLIRNAA